MTPLASRVLSVLVAAGYGLTLDELAAKVDADRGAVSLALAELAKPRPPLAWASGGTWYATPAGAEALKGGGS